MRYGSVIKLLVVLAGFVAAQQVHACACTEEEIILGVRAADRIFAGSVVEAEITESAPRMITFTVHVSHRLRGDTGDSTSLRTAMPGDCGARVRPSAYDLYVVAAGGDTVNACTVMHTGEDDSVRYIVSAIALLTYSSNSSPRGFAWLSDNMNRGYTVEDLGEVLALVQRMDPRGQSVIHDGRGTRYGNVRFIVSEGVIQVDAVE